MQSALLANGAPLDQRTLGRDRPPRRRGYASPAYLAHAQSASADLRRHTWVAPDDSLGETQAGSAWRSPPAPWWAWLGGFVGATYVTTVFMAIPEIGTAATVGLTIAGQQAASVLVDRYGWFRLPRRPLCALRLARAMLLLAGVAIVKML